MYNSPFPGSDTPNAMTPARIGPVQGVHPAAKPIPIKIDPT